MADNRRRARRKAGPGGHVVQVKLRRPRREADAAVHVKEAQIVARDPVQAEDQVVTDAQIHR